MRFHVFNHEARQPVVLHCAAPVQIQICHAVSQQRMHFTAIY